MSDMGNQTATATMRMSAEAIKLLAQLLKYLMETRDRSLNRKLKKEQIDQLKNNNGKLKLDKEVVESERGRVALKRLMKDKGIPVPFMTPLSQEQMKRFGKLASVYGLKYAVIENKERNKEIREELKGLEAEKNQLMLKGYEKTQDGEVKTPLKFREEYLSAEETSRLAEINQKIESLNKERKERFIVINEHDMPIAKQIIDKMNMELRLKNIQMELNAYRAKGEENMTEAEKRRFEELKNQEKAFYNGEFDKFNDDGNRVILDEAGGIAIATATAKLCDFETAVVNASDREYTDNPCYICDRANPDCYIEATTEKRVNDVGGIYNSTTFKVYNDGVEQSCEEFSHGKFRHDARVDGSASSSYGSKHWDNIKTEMQTKGNIGNGVVMFATKEEFDRFREELNRRKEKITVYEKNTEKANDKLDSLLHTSFKKDSSVLAPMLIAENGLHEASKGNMIEVQTDTYKKEALLVLHVSGAVAKTQKVSLENAESLQKGLDELKKESGLSDKDISLYSIQRDISKINQSEPNSRESLNFATLQREDTIQLEADTNSYRDFDGMINNLKGQLAEHNLTLNAQMEVVDMESNKPLSFSQSMSDNEKYECAEAQNIGKQIRTLESMNSVQNEIAFKNVQYKTNEEAYSNGTILKADYEKAQQGLVEEIKSSKQSYVELEKNLLELQTARVALGSVAVVNLINAEQEESARINENRENVLDNSRENTNDGLESTHGEERMGMSEWNNTINANQVQTVINDTHISKGIELNLGEKE